MTPYGQVSAIDTRELPSYQAEVQLPKSPCKSHKMLQQQKEIRFAVSST